MKILFTILAALSLGYSSYGQEIYWADTVLDFSSERKMSHHYSALHPKAFKANMALGHPNVLPGNAGTAKVWTPKGESDIDFIKVGFHKPIIVKQIAVSEVFSPSAITDIFLYTIDDEEIQIHTIGTKAHPIPSRLLLLFIDQTPKPIKALKVVLDGSKVPGFNGIDAIGISDSHEPIEIFAKIAEGVHTAVDPELLDENINSEVKDLKPLLSPDGNTMYFSRINHPENIGGEKDLEDIWISHRDPATNNWSKAVNAGPTLNNDGPNFVASVAPAGYTYQMLLGNQYHKSGNMIDGLSITTKTSVGFTDPENLEILGFENYSEHANYFLGADGRTIIMSVHRRDTHGDRDLYVSFVQPDGKWTVPLNLGEVINTGVEESSPFLALDGRTLYFSSKGHLGYGGNDVFVSRRLDDTWTNWSQAENLGTSVNSKEDDMFFYLSESDEKYAYFTRGNSEDADIYRLLLPLFQLPDPVIVMQGRVLNSKTKEPVGNARITLRDSTQRVIIDRQYSEKVTGRYRTQLPLGNYYQLYANSEGYITLESEEVDLTAIYESDTVERDILLDPIEVGQRIALDNIYFDFNKSTLRDESIPQLELIYDFLTENNQVEIELDGHTCTIGTPEYNQKLSENRALSVKRYLLDKGVRNRRIKSVGFGELAPLSTNETEEGRETNRRVEFVILEK